MFERTVVYILLGLAICLLLAKLRQRNLAGLRYFRRKKPVLYANCISPYRILVREQDMLAARAAATGNVVVVKRCIILPKGSRERFDARCVSSRKRGTYKRLANRCEVKFAKDLFVPFASEGLESMDWQFRNIDLVHAEEIEEFVFGENN